MEQMLVAGVVVVVVVVGLVAVVVRVHKMILDGVGDILQVVVVVVLAAVEIYSPLM
jgi:hypothetical protein